MPFPKRRSKKRRLKRSTQGITESGAPAAQNHADANQELVEHRLQSLRASHQARCNLLKDQAERARNDRIHRMKQAELERAGYDYERRVAELQRATESADIHATQVVAGVLQIMPKRT